MYCINNEFTNRQVSLLKDLRRLWEQHVLWTRSFIISTAASLGDLDAVTQRLLRNPVDFANLLRPLYGEEVADYFENILKQHLLIGADLVNAAKKGEEKAVKEARVKWYENADDIANFLAGINPNWSEEQWRSLFYSHLKMTEEEAVLRLQGNYAEDVAIYDMIEDEALRMADYMLEGIIKQFYIC